MVGDQLRARDIPDARVLDAMRKVPRHLFVPEAMRGQAYDDSPLPIGHDQTISQPYIVAFMTQGLQIEPVIVCSRSEPGPATRPRSSASSPRRSTPSRSSSLSRRARATLAGQGHRNVHVRHGNGYLGWPEHAPYDRIMVTAAPDEVPPALVEQLRVGGLMAIPVGTSSPGATHPAPDGHRPRNTRDAPGPVRADDRQAEAGSSE